MAFVADLHVHSRFAYAASKRLDLSELSHWAKLKGIALLSTGDFTHPLWLEDLSSSLKDVQNGLFEYGGVSFVLGAEICSISRHAGRPRRVHILLFVPSMESAKRLAGELARYGRVDADGRPTVRLSPAELVHLACDIDHRCLVVAAHIWTPWTGALGARYGFDSLEECFGDAVNHLAAVETGLSSDPAMNWSVPSLDRFALVSFSDAHSAPRLGREATVFAGPLGYTSLEHGLRKGGVSSTFEMHPALGKYHRAGHRRCGQHEDAEDAPGPHCPICGGEFTRGVEGRVQELALRKSLPLRKEGGLIYGPVGRPPFRRVVGLTDIISEAVGRGPGARAVQDPYFRLARELGGEMNVLTEVPLADIEMVAGEKIAEGVGIPRRGEVAVESGYDGQYGRVRIWATDDNATEKRLL